MDNLETAKRDAENWAKLMMRARDSADKLSLQNVENTLPDVIAIDTVPGDVTAAEDLAFQERMTRFWYGARNESISISKMNLALTSIQDSKGKMEALYQSLTAKTKSRKEMFTDQKRSITGLAKEKATAERAFNADMGEQQLKIADLNNKLDLVTKDIDLAKVNSEAAEIITLEAKKEALIQRKLDTELAVKNSKDAHRVYMARYQVTARGSERVSTKRKTTFEKIEDDTLTVEEALSYLNAAELSCKQTIALRQTRFLYIMKKVNNVRMPISHLSDVFVFSLLALLPTHVLEDRLEGFEMNFYLQDLTDVFYDVMSTELEFICKGTVKVVRDKEYSLRITNGRCTFLCV